MDPRLSAQDVVRCVLCQTHETPLYCEFCHMNLCKNCVEKHLSDPLKAHKVVSFQQYCTSLNDHMCMDHPTKKCDIYCEQCDIPVCILCFSKEHLGHKPLALSNPFESKNEVLQRDLQELEKYIFPRYNFIASKIPLQKDELHRNSQNLKSLLKKQGEAWHLEIDNVIKSLESDVDKMEHKNLDVLNKKEIEMNRNLYEIKKSIDLIKTLLKSTDVCRFSEYKSRNAEFRRLPFKLNVSLPNFKAREIKRDQLMEQFGSLSSFIFHYRRRFLQHGDQCTSVLFKRLVTVGCASGHNIF